MNPSGAPKNISQTGFNDSYSGVPPWDIGRPQKEIVALAEAGLIKGSVLDAGCGAGEHVLYFTSLGQKSWGIDFSPAAIEKAQKKALRCHSREGGNPVSPVFHVANALKLEELSRHAHPGGAVSFDNIIDTGLFHCFSDIDRTRYAKSLSQALAPCLSGRQAGGKYFMLCFSATADPPNGGSEHEPAEWGGPRRVTQQEIRDTFRAVDGWRVDFIREGVFETNFHPRGGRAWVTGVTRN